MLVRTIYKSVGPPCLLPRGCTTVPIRVTREVVAPNSVLDGVKKDVIVAECSNLCDMRTSVAKKAVAPSGCGTSTRLMHLRLLRAHRKTP